MSGITFGSVGDIITVGQIALALAQALSSSRGSAKEYQGLVKELQKFDQALLQVIALWQNYEESPELSELGTITKEIVNDWKDILLAFRLKVAKKYGDSLSSAGSGNWLKDAKHKVEWLKEKEDVLELRRKLHTASDTITMLVLAAMGISNRLADTAQAVRVEVVHGLLQESVKLAEEQMSKLKIMDEKLDLQTKSSNMILTTVNRGVYFLTQIPSIAIDMKIVLSLLRNQIVAQQATPKCLGGHWQQAPVTLEDALGFIIPIPLELVNSWEMFDMIISKRFEQHPGHGKVRRREFAIEDGATGREFSRKSTWSMCFTPGQKVDMSILFPDTNTGGNHCPRCRTKSGASSEVRIQCVNPTCKMWFQRVVEVDELDDFVETPQALSSQPEQSISQLPRRSAGPLIGPGDFQRVKLMSRTFRCHCGYVHTGEQKRQALNLRRHKRIHHSSESHRKIYKCEIMGCESVYSRSDALRAHKRERHSERHLSSGSSIPNNGETSSDESQHNTTIANTGREENIGEELDEFESKLDGLNRNLKYSHVDAPFIKENADGAASVAGDRGAPGFNPKFRRWVPHPSFELPPLKVARTSITRQDLVNSRSRGLERHITTGALEMMGIFRHNTGQGHQHDPERGKRYSATSEPTKFGEK